MRPPCSRVAVVWRQAYYQRHLDVVAHASDVRRCLMAGNLEITVNGVRHRVEATPDTPLLYVLRNELRLNGPKFGCGLSQCGACTVHLGDEAIRSCVTPVSTVGDEPITTLEGLGQPDALHPLQRAFIDEQAAQCAYCTNGMIMSAAALLKQN